MECRNEREEKEAGGTGFWGDQEHFKQWSDVDFRKRTQLPRGERFEGAEERRPGDHLRLLSVRQEIGV